MFAIIATGGKQYRVEKDQVLRVETLDSEPGSKIEFGEVLLVQSGKDTKIGNPQVEGAKVTATVLEHDKDKKVIVFKKKRRKQYRRTRGHRQHFTEVRIESIQA